MFNTEKNISIAPGAKDTCHGKDISWSPTKVSSNRRTSPARLRGVNNKTEQEEFKEGHHSAVYQNIPNEFLRQNTRKV